MGNICQGWYFGEKKEFMHRRALTQRIYSFNVTFFSNQYFVQVKQTLFKFIINII